MLRDSVTKSEQQTPSTDCLPDVIVPCLVRWALGWREKLRSFAECGKKTVPPKICPTPSVPRTWAGKGGVSDGSKRCKGDDRQHQVLLARRFFWGRILGQEGQAFKYWTGGGHGVDNGTAEIIVEKRAPQHYFRNSSPPKEVVRTRAASERMANEIDEAPTRTGGMPYIRKSTREVYLRW